MDTSDHNAVCVCVCGEGGGGPCGGLASHPGRSSNIPSCFVLQKPEISASLVGHWLVNRLDDLSSEPEALK